MALIEIFDFTDPYVDITNLFAYTNKNQICERRQNTHFQSIYFTDF